MLPLILPLFILGLEPSYVPFLQLLDGCSSSDRINAMKFIPKLAELEAMTQLLSQGLIQINGSRILNVMNECRKTQISLEQTCFPDKIKQSLATGCETIELRNTEFSNCLVDVQQKYFITKLTCLDSLSIYEQYQRNGTRLLEAEKNCVRYVMENICGVESTKDFDKFAAETVRISKSPETLISFSFMQAI